MPGYTVPLNDFRKALIAVRSFADTKDGTRVRDVVRLIPETDLQVVATDRYAVALARVPIEHRDTDDADFIDLALADVKKILDVFQMPKDELEAAQATLRIEPTEHELMITDASGMLDGDTLTIQRRHSSMPDPRRAINPRHLLIGNRLSTLDPCPMVSDTLLGKLRTASAAYGRHARLQFHAPTMPGRGAILAATIGPDFLLTCALGHFENTEIEADMLAWARDLRGIAGTVGIRDGDKDQTPAADEAPMTGQEELPLDSPTRDRDDVGGYPLRSVD